MESEGCCLLCLELKKEFVKAILINSAQCNSLSIKILIEKHLWTMEYINTTSWLCATCWTELYNFHNFYKRVERAHENFGLLCKEKTENDVDFKDSSMEKSINLPAEQINEYDDLLSNNLPNKMERHIVEFKETANALILDYPIGLFNDNIDKTERNPLLDIEIKKSPICVSKDKKLVKKISLSRNAKLRDKNRTKKANQIKIKPIPKNLNISKTIENAGDVESLSALPEPNLLIELEKEKLSFANDEDSKTESDSDALLSLQIKTNPNRNSRSKTIRSEPDKFLAENFKITCFLCDIPFDTFCNVLKHFEEQHKEPGYIKCCEKKFYRRKVLIDHVNYHLNPLYFKCTECDKVFEDRRRLELHSKSHEINNGKNFRCNTCGKGFIKIGRLNSHKKIHLSEEEKRFSCSECGKNFASQYMLSSHFRITHLKKYHKICEICGKSIQDKTIFERHMLQHKGKNSPSTSCDICGLLLTDYKALERHKKVIHPENGQKSYTCSICCKISPNLRSHKLHVRFTHESGCNYKCTICDKTFKRPQSLKEHMASHTGEILYKCPWCPKTFNSNANMHNHRKKIHPKEWEENSRKRYSGKLPPRFKPPSKIEKN